jgi:predicted enzyme related to lactoylglutathione lyase
LPSGCNAAPWTDSSSPPKSIVRFPPDPNERSSRPVLHSRAIAEGDRGRAAAGDDDPPVGLHQDGARGVGAAEVDRLLAVAREAGVEVTGVGQAPTVSFRRRPSHRIENRRRLMPGQIVHVEIPADDTAGGREFWGSMFGWTFESFPGPSEYHMTQITPGQTGGAITNMEPGKRGIRTYFDVDDINAGAARVKELGGVANDPMPVPGMGWFSTCTDPHGNEFGLWQNDTSAPAPAQ